MIWLSNPPLAAAPHAQVNPTSKPYIFFPEGCFSLLTWKGLCFWDNKLAFLWGGNCFLWSCEFIFTLLFAGISFVKTSSPVVLYYDGFLVFVVFSCLFVIIFGCSMMVGLSSSSPYQPALSPLITTETSETEITTTEIIKRRDVGPYGIRSEYCIRKIICPLGVPETHKGW